MSDLYKFRKSGDGYIAHRTTWEQHAADKVFDGAVLGAAAVAGGVIGLGARGVSNLTGQMRERKAMLLVEEFNAAQEAGDAEGMLRAADELVRRWPAEDYGYEERGTALMALGRADEAVAAFDRAVELGMDPYEGHLNRAMAFDAAGRTGEAIREFTALTNHPELAEVRSVGFLGRAMCLMELEDFEQALGDANQGIALQPDEQAYCLRARIHDARGDDEQSLADFRRALRLAPDNDDILQWRADKLERLGRSDEAAADRAAVAKSAPAPAEPALPQQAQSAVTSAGPRPRNPNLGVNPLARAALVCAFFIPGLAVIFALIALNQINKTGEGGRERAVAALAISGFWVLLLLIIVTAS